MWKRDRSIRDRKGENHTATARVGTLVLSLALAALVCGAPPLPAQEPETPAEPTRLTILSPEPGEVLAPDRPVEVRARLGELDLAGLAPIDVRLTITAPDRSVEIAAGDARPPDRPDLVGMTWDPAGIPPGRMELTLEVVAGDLEVIGSTTFILRPRPRVAVRLADLSLIDTGVEARFEARAAAADGAPIARYIWTAADGREPVITAEPSFTAVYPDLGADYSLAVEVVDAMGGTSLEHSLFSLPEDRQQIAAKLAACRGSQLLDGCLQLLFSSEARGAGCGCESMTVRSKAGDSTGVYCFNQRQQQENVVCNPVTGEKEVQEASCPDKTAPFTCPLRGVPPGVTRPVGIGQLVERDLGFEFEVVAKLTKGSAPAACREGQYVRSTSFTDGNQNLPGAVNLGVPQPPSGVQSLPFDEEGRKSFTFFVQEGRLGLPDYKDPKTSISRIYGLDNYAAKTGRLDPASKRYRANRITWRDRPGIQDLRAQRKGRYQGDFISFVRGGSSRETCWCQFTLDVSYEPPAAGAPPQATGKLEKVRGYRCTVSR